MLIPIKMASVHKHKGTKTSLTTGKKSYKYRELSEVQPLQQGLLCSLGLK